MKDPRHNAPLLDPPRFSPSRLLCCHGLRRPAYRFRELWLLLLGIKFHLTNFSSSKTSATLQALSIPHQSTATAASSVSIPYLRSPLYSKQQLTCNPLADNSFGLSQGRIVGTPQIAGIRPNSGTHYILTQRPAAGSLATSGRCVILHSLYVGCTNADAQAAANKPLSCLITLTSFDGKGKQNGVQKETYRPNELLLADMMEIEVKLPGAAVVQVNATILGETPLGGVGALVTALFVDDVKYTQYDSNALGVQKCGSGF